MKKFLSIFLLSFFLLSQVTSAYTLTKVDTRIATSKVKILNEKIKKWNSYTTIYKQQITKQYKKSMDRMNTKEGVYKNLDRNYAILQYVLENLIDFNSQIKTDKTINQTKKQEQPTIVPNCDNWWYYSNITSSCQPNSTIKTCSISNGIGQQTWNWNAWLSCNVSSCNNGYTPSNGNCIAKTPWDYCSSNQHLENDLCTPNTKTCSTQNWNWEQTWNGNIWSNCSINQAVQNNQLTCPSNQHIESNTCISNTKSCAIANWNWEQTWNGNYFGDCKAVSCNIGYEKNINSMSCSLLVTMSQYPWCDTPDIALWDKIWSACNVWSSIAGFGAESYGWYYQWWRNDTWFTVTNEASPYDWQTSNGDAWWDTTDTFIARQGPCSIGYHVPSQTEWMRAVEYSWGKYNTLRNTLRLPSPGWRGFDNAEYYGQGTTGAYWSSSPVLSGSKSYFIIIYTWNWSVTGDWKSSVPRAVWYSVRCVKN